MNQPIAITRVLIQRAGEAPMTVSIEIGLPRQVSDSPEEWICPLSLSPLYSRPREVHAGDAFQSICLAATSVLSDLHAIVESGGTISFTTGERFPLEAYPVGSWLSSVRPKGDSP